MPTSDSSKGPVACDLDILEALYYMMLKIRLTEERIVEIYPSDKIQSPIHLSIGQEAVAAGVCGALQPKDHIYGTYRGHGIYLAKGGDLNKLMAELYAKATGCARGKGGSMHLVAPEAGLMGCSAIVSSTIPVATGDALASQMQGRNRVVVAFFGDGAVDEGVFFESINFAALKNLPIIYVCENNRYAIHSKVEDRHRQTQIFKFGEAAGLRGERLDGNHVRTVYKAISESVDDIRAGGPPRLLEFMTYRWHEHVGPGIDHAETYRDQSALASASVHDPLKLAESELRDHFKVPQKKFDEWRNAIALEIDAAVEFAEKSPFPVSGELFDDVYEVTP